MDGADKHHWSWRSLGALNSQWFLTWSKFHLRRPRLIPRRYDRLFKGMIWISRIYSFCLDSNVIKGPLSDNKAWSKFWSKIWGNKLFSNYEFREGSDPWFADFYQEELVFRLLAPRSSNNSQIIIIGFFCIFCFKQTEISNQYFSTRDLIVDFLATLVALHFTPVSE